MKAEYYGYTSQLDALAERLSQLPKSVSATPIFKQMEKVEKLKKEAEAKLQEIKKMGARLSEPPIDLKSYEKFLESLKSIMKTASPEMKSKIIRRLIHRIEVGKKEVKIYYNVDKSSLVREPMYLGSRIFFMPKTGQSD